jgi:hypothetical protein
MQPDISSAAPQELKPRYTAAEAAVPPLNEGQQVENPTANYGRRNRDEVLDQTD